ncbi:MAG TPA: alpha-ketoacid dehydrogenase subunit beta [Actinomycetota bacterium]|nr:alpha-ketoacid dehydrogenase subunit beta [Actinomycetota bacterium]
MASVTLAQSLNEALRASLRDDDRVVVMGEDVGINGGVFRITDKLQAEFGEERVIDTPLAESGIVGTAIGMAMYGLKPVCEMQFDGFTYPAFEQLVSHLAKFGMRSKGKFRPSVVVRIPYGGGIGAVEHHSESPEAYFAHTAGLRVVCPSTPSDAYSLLIESIQSPDPVIFFEPKRRYWIKEEVDLPTTTQPMGNAVVRREGTDVTLISYGPMMRVALDAAEEASSDGVGVEVIDLRTISPLDVGTVLESVRKTGRAVIVHEANVSFGVGAELAARIAEADFTSLEAPVIRVGGWDMPYPPAKLEEEYLPDVDRVLDALDAVLNY